MHAKLGLPICQLVLVWQNNCDNCQVDTSHALPQRFNCYLQVSLEDPPVASVIRARTGGRIAIFEMHFKPFVYAKFWENNGEVE